MIEEKGEEIGTAICIDNTKIRMTIYDGPENDPPHHAV